MFNIINYGQSKTLLFRLEKKLVLKYFKLNNLLTHTTYKNGSMRYPKVFHVRHLKLF